MTSELYSQGVDSVEFTSTSAGQGGYGLTLGSDLSKIHSQPLQSKDVLLVEAGAKMDGYWNVSERNWDEFVSEITRWGIGFRYNVVDLIEIYKFAVET